MAKEFITYQNREVPKEGFRVYIYHPDGSRKLVNSWDEFTANVIDGDWFSTEMEAKYVKQEECKNELFTMKELEEADQITKTVNLEPKKRGRKRK
jgi:hypothetical protein